MKRIKYKYILPLFTLIVIVLACSKSFLEITPPGTLNSGFLANKLGVEGLLVGAYSLLDGVGGAGSSNGEWANAASNWVYGSVTGGDAHKGSDPGDQNQITPIETWNVNASNTYLDDIWRARFDGVQRANETLRLMVQATDMSAEDITQVTAEARFLRGHYMFELKKLFGNVPWIDETIAYTEKNFLVPNNTDVFPNIEADLQYAYDNLPEDYTGGDFEGQYGRANKWAAGCYLAKALLFEKKFSDAKTLLTTIIASGKTSSGESYGLIDHFADNFDPAKKNSMESVFAAQMSVNDGAVALNANAGDVLNFPYGGPGGCCGFFQPSFSLVNSYKVDAAGLPFLDGSFNNTDLKSDQGVGSNDDYAPDSTTAVDPRLDWTAGRRGIPFLDFGPMPGADWIRNQASAGPYVAMKNLYYKSQEGDLTDNSSWTPGYTANNVTLIRFADVLLWAGEAEIEAGSLDQAQTYVNMIRTRASDSAGFVQGSPARYKIGLYPAGAFTTGGQDYARKALYFERKLELALEGHRFFDLARWGTAQAELNAYAQHEANVSGYLLIKGAVFTAGKNEILPIPQAQIDKSVAAGASVLTQNPGY